MVSLWCRNGVVHDAGAWWVCIGAGRRPLGHEAAAVRLQAVRLGRPSSEQQGERTWTMTGNAKF